MFRTLGLRQLCITNKHNQIKGIITRADLVASHILRQSKAVRKNAFDLIYTSEAGKHSQDNLLLDRGMDDTPSYDNSASSPGIQLSSLFPSISPSSNSNNVAIKHKTTPDGKYFMLHGDDDNHESKSTTSNSKFPSSSSVYTRRKSETIKDVCNDRNL